jgi:hypothetical protein
MSQLPAAVGAAALCAPVVLAIVGSVRSSTTPATMQPKTPGSTGSAINRGVSHTPGGKGGGGGVGAGGLGSSMLGAGASTRGRWVSSRLGKLVQVFR